MYGAPNGLCSSITENKHIKAVKEPWHCLNHHEALGQMLLINQHLEKLAAARVDFTAHGMMNPSLFSSQPATAEPVNLLQPTNVPMPGGNEGDDEVAIEGPKCFGEVRSSKGHGTHFAIESQNIYGQTI
jgi:hypothetical protein